MHPYAFWEFTNGLIYSHNPMEYKYLVSRFADPVIAITLGVSAYYVHEKRVGRSEGHTLNELLARWWNK